ncbi:hypothetical protein CBER1_06240 [Cercospora berteroae]|uniref:Uncharacterized protein n=1 Tax=Cercospora berteroae TaxID=357750 RepID=A0A2S6CCP7_9PEZI|nr:hypothetical protein CBER1_06240 [Cercospora berteroae]
MNQSSSTPGAFKRSGSVTSGQHGSDTLFVQDVASDGERPSKRSKYTDAGHENNSQDDSVVEQTAQRSLSPTPTSKAVIDVDEEEEQYYLEAFKQWLPKLEVEGRLKNKYAEIFKQQAGQAMPNTHNRQRMEEIAICARDEDTSVRYILSRDKKVWCLKLKGAEKALRLEHDQIMESRDKQKRPEYKHILDECLIAKSKAKVRTIERDLELRKKIVKGMNEWVRDE